MQNIIARRFGTPLCLACAALAAACFSGCPYDPQDPDEQAEYDAGFAVGFAEDEEYWTGFDDSWDTVDAGPIYYQGADIPYMETPPYDAGYWDGVWCAYHDGYFVAYDYAFTIGFSEGYALAYAPDWADFLAYDTHLEYLDGGFTDGYNDGFSEGRVFGAWDYANDWPFDWLDAMLDYRDGTDLEIGGVGTGEYGPVYLYEYGTDPNDPIEGKRAASKSSAALRAPAEKAEAVEISYRALTQQIETELNVRPEASPRDGARALSLGTTWLERVEAYREAYEKKAGNASRLP